MGGQPQRYGNFLFWGERGELTVGGGLGCVKWLKCGVGKCFISYGMIPALYHFW